MSALSISKAWDETKLLIKRDGKLYAAVALALVILPAVIAGLVDPRVQQNETAPLWFNVVLLVSSLLSLAGQLAIIRLIFAPSVTVGESINHGFRRLPVYFASLILIALGMIVVMIPIVLVAKLLGLPIEQGPQAFESGPGLLLVLGFMIAVVVFASRLILTMPVASAEPAGPIRILARSLTLTANHWLKLIGFLLLVLVSAILILAALATVSGIVVTLAFGPIEPMTVGALFQSLIEAVLMGVFTIVFTVLVTRIYVQLSQRETIEAPVP